MVSSTTGMGQFSQRDPRCRSASEASDLGEGRRPEAVNASLAAIARQALQCC